MHDVNTLKRFLAKQYFTQPFHYKQHRNKSMMSTCSWDQVL